MEFVRWKEELICQDRGNRVVHYYLLDSAGDSHLAVVGTERSLRHMLYVVTDAFARKFLFDNSRYMNRSLPPPMPIKWRSRREAIDWLASFLPSADNPRSVKFSLSHALTPEVEMEATGDCGNYLFQSPYGISKSLTGDNSDILWCDDPWFCGKQLQHYRAFSRNGITVPTHSFVLVMSEEESCYLAYIEDMYEDKKGHKKVKVRWFHQNQEFACSIPSPPPHPCEVFITTVSQVISAECVNNLATVLTPDHYNKCLASLPHVSSKGIYLCFRQYSNSRFKRFDLSALTGYFDQAVFLSLGSCTMPDDDDDEDEARNRKRIATANGRKRIFMDHLGDEISSKAAHMMGCRLPYKTLLRGLPPTRPVTVKFIGPRSCIAPLFKINDKIEILCQDSGIRGCWFKGTVLQVSEKRVKVQYDDLQNEEECGNLEEWIPTFKPAAPDKLGMRLEGRLTIRPCLPDDSLPDVLNCEIGSPIDAWWNDGWWEGVIVGVDNTDKDNVQVYLPGEDVFLVCQKKFLRISKDWVGNCWVDVNAKPDILSVISTVNPGGKISPSSILPKSGEESGSSAMSERCLDTAKISLPREETKAVSSLSSGNGHLFEETDKGNRMHKDDPAEKISKDDDS